MVKLNKIYTRTGDTGETGLVGGTRVPKQGLRVSAYGEVDETNAMIGIARRHTGDLPLPHAGEGAAPSRRAVASGTGSGAAGEGNIYDAMLERIQHDLFDLGADLATAKAPSGAEALRIVPSQVERLEQEIDDMNAALSPLNSFVLPGGTDLAATLHLARCIARRAERTICALAAEEEVNPLAVQYINRLSDHLFVMARAANENGAKDVLWKPGVNR